MGVITPWISWHKTVLQPQWTSLCWCSAFEFVGQYFLFRLGLKNFVLTVDAHNYQIANYLRPGLIAGHSCREGYSRVASAWITNTLRPVSGFSDQDGHLCPLCVFCSAIYYLRLLHGCGTSASLCKQINTPLQVSAFSWFAQMPRNSVVTETGKICSSQWHPKHSDLLVWISKTYNF